MPGYSGTPLAQKLGLKPPLDVLLLGEPADYRTWLGDLPSGVSFVGSRKRPVQAAHLFVTERSELARHLTKLRGELEQAGFIWISWPKKSSKVGTDITEDTIREVALPLGFVDIKVCAVSDVWSGLKLVIRKTERR
jgi:hypothetical protein